MLLRSKHITLSALQRFRLGTCAVLCVWLLASCSLEPADDTPTDSKPTANADRLLILCEGLWGMNNASLSLLDHGVLTNHWFRQQNPGERLGDTANDILQVNDTLIAISVNWSNIVQYIRPDGTAIAATENIPNNRRMATDHRGFLYVTSYADHGYVAKIDLRTKLVATWATSRRASPTTTDGST